MTEKSKTNKLDDLKKVLTNMTPGRWRAQDEEYHGGATIDIPGRPVLIATTHGDRKGLRNADGIVALRNAAPWLLEYVGLLEEVGGVCHCPRFLEWPVCDRCTAVLRMAAFRKEHGL